MGKPNITIIVLDTLRLDAFMKLKDTRGRRLSDLGDFHVFGNCIAPASWTLPSHASLFTGMYPSEHGAHETKRVKALDIAEIKLRKRTFVSDLKELGYETYAISANPYVHPVYGFDEFDSFREESYFVDIWGSVFEVASKLKPLIAKYRNEYGSDIFKISASMLRQDPNLFLEAAASGMILTPIAALKKLRAKFVEGWPIEKGGKNIVKTVKGMKLGKPFFMFINIMEAHDPYTDSKKTAMSWVTPFLKKRPDAGTISLWKRLYGKASQRAYEYAYRIVQDLIGRFGENQIIILTSDHGQEFNEHGFIGHGAVLHDEVVKVPIAVLLPKGFRTPKAKGYSSLVSIRDFLLAALDGDKNAAERIFRSHVIAESFGVPAQISQVKGIDSKKLRSYEKTTRRKFG
ncbi:MAG: sulfatase-like hydrolase/transferase [Candidatus Micrarchaeota archaeon]|nr:sulfatase-like hydrolase/transferase [Candidatus Micrarchaeota archaeon]